MAREIKSGCAHTRARWQRLVTAWRRSGKTAAEFAGARGIVESTLRWWSWRLARDGETAAATGSALALVPVRVIADVDPVSPRKRRDDVVRRSGARVMWTLRTAQGEISVYAAEDTAALRAAIGVLIGGGS